MSNSDANTPIIETDPIYGVAMANYPSDRGRLLLAGGVVYAISGTVLNAAFASVDAATASIIVISGMAPLALGIGWVILHQWNREVVLYERGFSYREGSRTVYLFYSDIRMLKLRAGRVRYFGGLVRRNIRELTLKTTQDETIVLNTVYRRIEELCERLELAINRAQRPIIEARLTKGERVEFGGGLALLATGIRLDAQQLAWADYVKYSVADGKLTLHTAEGAAWGSVA
ncbi:MAG: hypothetical protein H7Y11_04925, partial [Armatimonadetes bacterium]|nr:hypothetical protein [Anaerolineae bacterium]